MRLDKKPRAILVARFLGCCLCIGIINLESAAFALSLSDAQQDYLFGNYESAIEKAQGLQQSDEVLYFLGLVNLKTGEYERARSSFNKLLASFPGSALRLPAKAKLADVYFMEKNYDAAWKIYQEIESKSSTFDGMPHVLLRLAQIASRKGLWQEKNAYLSRIKQAFPQSPEMRFVEALEGYGDFFTIQVGAFSDRKNALALQNELSKNYKAYITEEANGSYTLYKVKVGRFKDRHEVEQINQKLQSEGYPARIYP